MTLSCTQDESVQANPRVTRQPPSLQGIWRPEGETAVNRRGAARSGDIKRGQTTNLDRETLVESLTAFFGPPGGCWFDSNTVQAFSTRPIRLQHLFRSKSD